MAIDLFLCTQDYSSGLVGSKALREFRSSCFQKVEDRWFRQPDINYHVLLCNGREWQRLRRMEAERLSSTGIYLVADDDCLPQPFYVSDVRRTFKEHPDFAILSMTPSNEYFAPWTPEDYAPFEDEWVVEKNDVGGLRFMRQGAMTEWPEMVQGRMGYDATQCEWLRKHGWKVGYLRQQKCEHLGKGMSTTWPSN